MASEINKTKSMIVWLCTVQYKAEQKKLGVKWGPHPTLKQQKLIDEIAYAAEHAARKNDLPVSLVLVTAWRESRFLKSVSTLERLGLRGERGLMQVHGTAAYGCNLKSVSGQVLCGARWLRRSLDACDGDLFGGITMYRSGACKTKKSTRLWRGVKGRIDLMVRLEKNSGGESGFENVSDIRRRYTRAPE
jgi:hypothetical protein